MIEVNTWKVEGGLHMDIMDPDNHQYFQLAIQTVLYLNRDHISLLMDDASKENYIKSISDEIMSRACKFKRLTTASIEELQH